ncbi:MAG: lysylphosphatidylglycerol synthase domain-containing protein, partial [Flavobacteriaceae bacterium]|nr:lysylphosphatidylglycerol synthase domain-containing protein [Flavobacteriaceae bacterium]
ILLAFEIAIDKSLYLFIFLVSSIVAVLPLTIGGIGSREVVFLYGALWLGLEEDVSVSISLVFLAITALVSFAGLYYHLKPPQLTAKE